MKFLPSSCMCRTGRHRSGPKSNVAVKKLKKSRKRRRSRNSYIESSFKSNVYPIEQFPPARPASVSQGGVHNPMERFHVKSRRHASRPRKPKNHWTALTVLPVNDHKQMQQHRTLTPLCDNNNNDSRFISPLNFVTASYYLNQNQSAAAYGRRQEKVQSNKTRHRIKVCLALNGLKVDNDRFYVESRRFDLKNPRIPNFNFLHGVAAKYSKLLLMK